MYNAIYPLDILISDWSKISMISNKYMKSSTVTSGSIKHYNVDDVPSSSKPPLRDEYDSDYNDDMDTSGESHETNMKNVNNIKIVLCHRVFQLSRMFYFTFQIQ